MGNKRYERIDKPGVSGEDTRDSSNGGNNSHKIFACLCYSHVWLYFHICFALSLFGRFIIIFFFSSKIDRTAGRALVSHRAGGRSSRVQFARRPRVSRFRGFLLATDRPDGPTTDRDRSEPDATI